MFQTAYTHENLPKVRYLDPFHDVSIRNPNGFRYNAVLMPKMPTFTPYGDPNTRIFVNLVGKSYQCSKLRTALKMHQNWHIYTLSDMWVSENLTDIEIMPWRCRHADMCAPYCRYWSYNLIWCYASNCLWLRLIWDVRWTNSDYGMDYGYHAENRI